MRLQLLLASILLLLSPVNAQLTTTVIDPLGETVVEVITTDLLGNELTETILTLTGTTFTTTVVDPLGETVVEVIQSDPTGIPVTQTILTLTTTSTTALPAATTPLDQGPVGQPGATNTASETPFTYTTIVDGVTNEVVATFTPSFASTAILTPTSSGSIMAYSDWLSIYGSAATSTATNAAMKMAGFSQGWLGVLVGAVAGVAGGVCFVLL